MYIIKKASKFCTIYSATCARLLVCILFPYVFKKCRCRHPEDGEIIATKHVGAIRFFTQFPICNSIISRVALNPDMPFSRLSVTHNDLPVASGFRFGRSG